VAADRFYAHLEAVYAAPAGPSRITRLGHLAMRAITLLERYCPALGRAAERIVHSRAARVVVRWLLRPAPATPVGPEQVPDSFDSVDLDADTDCSPPDQPAAGHFTRSVSCPNPLAMGSDGRQQWPADRVQRTFVAPATEPHP
jgi:hypothetical protein